MRRRGGRDEYALDGFIVQNLAERGGGFYVGDFPFYQPGFSFRRNADVFQRYTEVMKNGIEIGQRVLAHADKGV